MKKILQYGIPALILAFSMFVIPNAIMPNYAQEVITPKEKITRQYIQALDIIREKSGLDIDQEVLGKASIQGMLKNLDPHSDYLDPKSFKEFEERQNSQYFGIGAHIRNLNKATYIIEPIKGSPAAGAGFRYGDHIIEVDGKDTSRLTSDKVRQLLLGPEGTKVNMAVKRIGVAEPIKVTITRAGIALPSIPNYYMAGPNTGYIGLTRNFQRTTSDELSRAISSLREQGAESFVLDLRQNGGGYLDQAIRVMDQFLQRGQTIVSVKGRDEEQSYVAQRGSTTNFPLVVLIDRNSASASEIVAGAVQDHDRGLIVGETSFGKGLVQRIFPLSNKGALTLTIMHYYTPSGRLIQRDYSNGSLFDYYTKRTTDNHTQSNEKRTDLGRTVFGGGGIEPDTKVESSDYFLPNQGRLFIAASLFVKDLTGGAIAGFPQYKLNGISYDHKVKGNEFIVGDDLLKTWREYALKLSKDNPQEFDITTAILDKNNDWLRKIIRQEILIAAYGIDKSQQVLSPQDATLQKAITEIPKAADLANKARQTNTSLIR